MKAVIEDLNRKQEQLKKELQKIDVAIEALQDVCTHTLEDGTDAYECEGHDSHKDYFVCSICGDSYSI